MMDNDPLAANLSLKEALGRFKNTATETNRFTLYDELLKASFLIPIILSPDFGKDENIPAQGKENSAFSFVCLINEEKERFLTAFSGQDELDKLERSEDYQISVLSLDAIAAILSDKRMALAGFVIDPYGNSLSIDKELAAFLTEHSSTNEEE